MILKPKLCLVFFEIDERFIVALRIQIAAVRDSGTNLEAMTTSELRQKVQKQQLIIQTMATERNILNRYLELISGQEGKKKAMEQLSLCKELSAENVELKLRLRLFANGQLAGQLESSVSWGWSF